MQSKRDPCFLSYFILYRSCRKAAGYIRRCRYEIQTAIGFRGGEARRNGFPAHCIVFLFPLCYTAFPFPFVLFLSFFSFLPYQSSARQVEHKASSILDPALYSERYIKFGQDDWGECRVFAFLRMASSASFLTGNKNETEPPAAKFCPATRTESQSSSGSGCPILTKIAVFVSYGAETRLQARRYILRPTHVMSFPITREQVSYEHIRVLRTEYTIQFSRLSCPQDERGPVL